MASTRESYLNYVKRILEHYEVDFPNRIVQEFPFNEQSLGGFVGHLVNAWAQMYRVTGDPKYARRARDLLLYWSKYPAHNPPGEKAKLSVGPFISCMLVGGLRVLRDNGFLTPEEEEPVWNCIFNMVNILVDPYVKQGKEKLAEKSHAWNHPTMDMTLAVETAQTFPNHPDAAKWMEWGRLVLNQSFNKPTVEDATNYTPIWFLHTIRAAEFLGLNQDFFAYPYTRYYFQYLRDLIAPTGQLQDFGDTTIFGDWVKTLAILEKAASVYRDGTYKTAAHKLFQYMSQRGPVFGGELNFTPSEAMLEFNRNMSKEMMAAGGYYAHVAGPSDPKEEYSLEKVTQYRSSQAAAETSFLLLTYLWADDNVSEEAIPARSILYERRAILKDEDSYLLYGLEDWTKVHGQGEGNAVNLLLQGDSILLHESGYHWRQRRYHNTVIWKEGMSDDPFNYLWEPQERLVMLKVRPPERRATVPIFEPLSRAVLLRSQLGEFQRTVVKAKEAAYVFDYLDVKGAYTAACFWHTQKIVERGEKYFRTRIPNLCYPVAPGYFYNYDNPGDCDLVITFPNAKATGVEKEIRSDADELVIYQMLSENFSNGAGFSSILYPVKGHEPHLEFASKVEAAKPSMGSQLSYPQADGIKLSLSGETVYICSKNVASPGVVSYGDLESDADILYLKTDLGRLRVSAVNVSTLTFKGEKILSTREKYARFEV